MPYRKLFQMTVWHTHYPLECYAVTPTGIDGYIHARQ
jgi:hypothetical protein